MTGRLLRPPGVFAPCADSHLLARSVTRMDGVRGARVLDLCTGTGLVAIAAALAGAREVTAVDLSRRAVLATWVNARRAGARVRVLRGDLDAPVAGRRFDLVTANPPYLPSADGRARSARGAARAWEGGPSGRAFIDPICDASPRLLAPGGHLVLVHTAVNGIAATLERLTALGLSASVVARHRGPPGPLLASRARGLAERGMACGAVEELVVIRARGPGGSGRGADGDLDHPVADPRPAHRQAGGSAQSQ